MKRSAIISALKTALETAFPDLEVVANDFSAAATKTMEEALREEGVCISIPPLLGSKLLSQSAARAAERAAFVVQLRVNRNVQLEEFPAFEPYDAHETIIDTVLAVAPLEIKASDDQGNMTVLVLADQPNLTHGIHFTVQLNR